MAVDIPESIGRYRVEAVIGTGGFATVYRAIDERLDAPVAIKLLAENHSHDPDIRERFLKEGRALRRIDSPHVVRVHDMGETERGQPYLVLDYADGGNLSQRVLGRWEQGWQPIVADVLLVAEALAGALESAHASDLVHRDVAPRNLLIRSAGMSRRQQDGLGPLLGPLLAHDERILLADLGLSKDLAAASGLTIGGGTAGFVPPEQRGSPTTVDARSDIWAACAVMVWLVSGDPPDDEGRWRQRVVSAGWPEPLVDALALGLSWQPSSRYHGVSLWLAAVREALTPSEPIERPAMAQPRWPWHVAGAVACIVLGFGAAWLTVGQDGESGATEQTEQELSGGRLRVEATSGGRSVAIVGPEEITVGREATFEAESDGVDEVVWVGPDGQIHEGTSRLSISADSSGSVTITLIGIDGAGRTVVATHVASAR
jgi:hypothetical protein